MDALNVSAVVVLGLALRLGLPLALTALAIWLLWQADRRWQTEAEGRRARITAAVAKGVRCWEIRGCSPERRAACGAFAQSNMPCWQYFRDQRGYLLESCLDCEVFRRAPIPAVAPA